jgi:phosphoenolpyruvate phosphomutase
VPTTYNTIRDTELRALGYNIVIHANHLLRAAYKSMRDSAEKILVHDRSFETDAVCATTKEIFNHVGFTDISQKDRQFAPRIIPAIIPAAGSDPEFNIPKAVLQVKGKTVLERQHTTLAAAGIRDVVIIRGFGKEHITREGITYFDNDNYSTSGIANSLFYARDYFEDGFLYIHSDIIFSADIIRQLLVASGDIILAVDNSYTYHKHNIDKELDLVISRNKSIGAVHRAMNVNRGEVVRIGKKVTKDDADYEFTGIARFSEKGAELLIKLYDELSATHTGPFHESESFAKASFTDLIQELISRDIKVEFINVYKGWFEIHDKKDLLLAEEIVD